MVDSGELVEILDLGSARGGRKPEVEISCEIVRRLEERDLPGIREASPGGSQPGQAISKIRTSHHLLARSLAMGMDNTEASAATGYSPTYISILGGDPTFKGLVEYYKGERAAMFVDAIQRYRSLGLDAVEELQDRLASDPAGWTKRELMELVRGALVDTSRGGNGGGGSGDGSGVVVNVKFVGGSERAGGAGFSPVIDLEPQE